MGDAEVLRDVGAQLPGPAALGQRLGEQQVAVVQRQPDEHQDHEQDADDERHDAVAEEGGGHGSEGTASASADPARASAASWSRTCRHQMNAANAPNTHHSRA